MISHAFTLSVRVAPLWVAMWVAGCGHAHVTSAPHVASAQTEREPRGATGQLLEDLFFDLAPGSERFDADAALDEGGGGVSYNEYAAGAAGDYDAYAAGAVGAEGGWGEQDGEQDGQQEQDAARASYAQEQLAEVRDLRARVLALQAALAAESHPLASALEGALSELQESLESPELFPDQTLVRDVRENTLLELERGATAYVHEHAARPAHATDCSVATLALYVSLYDLFIDLSAEAHLQIQALEADDEEWRNDQRLHLNAAQGMLRWLEGDPYSSTDFDDLLERAETYMNDLYDPSSLLTPESGPPLEEALAALYAAETESTQRAALDDLRGAVSATLGHVQASPMQAQLAAYRGYPDLLRRMQERSVEPGPRAALRMYQSAESQAALSAIQFTPADLNAVADWTAAACEGHSSP